MEVFGSGGGAVVAEALSRALGTSVPLLGQIPLDTRLRESGDDGVPLVVSHPESEPAQTIFDIARTIDARRVGGFTSTLPLVS
jgi:ATP-binding protein involved in chromosome partitioning